MKFTITKPGDFDRIINYLSKIDVTKQWSVSILLLKSKRSIDQNKLYWVWLGIIESETGTFKDELHEYFKERFLGFTIRKVFESEVKIINSTTKLNTKEFTTYLESIRVFVSQELGITLLTPDEQNFDQFCNEFNINY